MVTVFPSEIQEIVWGRLNVLVATSDDAGTIVYANTNVANLYGYLPGELVGKSVDDLVPVAAQNRHRAHRIAFNANPTERAMGERLSLEGRHKNGSTFAVRIQLIPCVLRTNPVTIAIIYAMPGGADAASRA